MTGTSGVAKVSDIIAEQLALHGCNVIFGVSGGASLHLLQSIIDHPKLRLITVHHEQTVAMAAEAYSRITGKMGVGVVTSGPGATNLTTGIAGAYFDSVPCLFLTGQVSTFRRSKGLGVRQYGFQETPTSQIFQSITKRVIEIEDANQVSNAMSEAFMVALEGRPGPVVIDIPDNIQREIEVLPGELDTKKGNRPQSIQSDLLKDAPDLKGIQSLIQESLRPVIVCGWGSVLAKKESELLGLLDTWKVPAALTWGAKHLVPDDREYLLGSFGTHGNRTANRAIQESDLIISFGSRLDTKATGSPPDSFAPGSKIFLFDIDINEIKKFDNKGVKIDGHLEVDFRDADFSKILEVLKDTKWNSPKVEEWQNHIKDNLFHKEEYPSNSQYVNPYKFLTEVSEVAPSLCRVIVDTGCSIAWVMQAWKVKAGQRIYHDFNNTAMGWSIPASLASMSTLDSILTICIVGDGSLMMTIGELATLHAQESPLIIFIMNNSGYSMIRQTQDQWFNSKYFASDSSTGMAFPNYRTLAQAFGFDYLFLKNDLEIHEIGKLLTGYKGKLVVEILLDPLARVIPQNRFGSPIDVMDPCI